MKCVSVCVQDVQSRSRDHVCSGSTRRSLHGTGQLLPFLGQERRSTGVLQDIHGFPHVPLQAGSGMYIT